MGYTIYFEQNRNFTTQEWGDIRAACIPMFNRLKQIKGGNGLGRPWLGNGFIIFNGDASKGEDHETFHLSKVGAGFQFCKTARKPYDRFVKAVLVIANYYAPGALKVTCDGDDEDDCWTEGVRIATLYAHGIPGKSPCSPLELKDAPKASKFLPVPLKDQVMPATKDAWNDIDEAIELLAKIGKGNKVHSFLANYLKANIEDIKDAWVP